MPDHNDISAINILDHRVQQVHNIVRRLILLLSNEDFVDIGTLRSLLRLLFNQLATLNHRAFPALVPSILSDRKAFQHSLRIARRGVQAVYKELWAAALQTGLLRGSGGCTASAGTLDRPDALVTEQGRRSIVLSRAAGVQRLLWRSRELADELRFWLALLRAGRRL